MSNIFTETAKRLEIIQKKLIENKAANESLIEKFNINIQNNLEYLHDNYPEFYKTLTKNKIKSKQIICFENGEANLLDLKTGTLLYGNSPITETRKQVVQWLKGCNVFVKSKKKTSKPKLDDRICQLHSYTQFMIEKEIETIEKQYNGQDKWKEHEIPQEVPLLVINGGGLGYPLVELCTQIEPAFIFYIEPDIETFLCSLGVINWAEILDFLKKNNQQINFIIGETGIRSHELFYDNIWLTYPFLQAYQLIFTHYSSIDTSNFLIGVKSNIEIGFNSNGMFDDTLFGLNNIILNSQKYRYVIKQNTNKFKDLPVAIIANGPSLDNDLKYLYENKDNFITIACGTAITALDKIGIIPDFYVALERLDEVYKSLLYVQNDKIFNQTINISANVVHPLTMEKFKTSLIVNKPGESLSELFGNDNLINQQCDNLLILTNSNPLVANCATSIFFNLNFSNFYLFGIDNGSTTIDKHHSSQSYYNDLSNTQNHNVLNNFDTTKVKGNFNEDIYTNDLFNLCRYKIETEIKSHININVYNCSNGAYIEGTIPIHSYEIPKLKDISKLKSEYKNFLINNCTKQVEITQSAVEKLIDRNLFNDTVNQIQSILETHNKRHTRLSIIMKMKRTMEFLQQHDNLKFIHTILAGSLGVYFSLMIYAMYIFKSEKISVALANSCIKQIIDFIKMSQYVYLNASKLIQGQHFKFIPQKIYDNWKKENNINK